jgi:hypothetical protein
MTIERSAVVVTTARGESRGIQLTEETFDPSGLVITVEGELDVATAPTLRDRLETAVDPASYAMLVFESGGLSQVLDLVESRAQAIVHVSR